MYQRHVILRQLRRNTGSLHQWIFLRTTAWQSMAYYSGAARRDRRFPLLTPWQYLRIRQPAALARDCSAKADNDYNTELSVSRQRSLFSSNPRCLSSNAGEHSRKRARFSSGKAVRQTPPPVLLVAIFAPYCSNNSVCSYVILNTGTETDMDTPHLSVLLSFLRRSEERLSRFWTESSH